MVFCISLIGFAIVGIDAILYGYILKYEDTTFVISLFVWNLVMFQQAKHHLPVPELPNLLGHVSVCHLHIWNTTPVRGIRMLN